MSEVAGANSKFPVVIRYGAKESTSLANRFPTPFARVVEVALDVNREEPPAADKLSAWQSAVLHLVLDRPSCDLEQIGDVLAGIGRLKLHPLAAKHCFEEGIE